MLAGQGRPLWACSVAGCIILLYVPLGNTVSMKEYTDANTNDAALHRVLHHCLHHDVYLMMLHMHTVSLYITAHHSGVASTDSNTSDDIHGGLFLYIKIKSFCVLTQVENVDHGLQPQGLVQRHHSHGVRVAGQL